MLSHVVFFLHYHILLPLNMIAGFNNDSKEEGSICRSGSVALQLSENKLIMLGLDQIQLFYTLESKLSAMSYYLLLVTLVNLTEVI